VSDFIGRIFVLAFSLIYVVLLIALLAWNFRNWFVTRSRKDPMRKAKALFSRLDLSQDQRELP